MKVYSWLAELKYRNYHLYRIGLINLILFFLLFIPLLLDSREVMGINTWIKPMKFALSITIFTWTFGWILFDLPDSRKWIKGITWTIAITMFIEIVIILYQAARATRSHFNFDTGFDSILFGIMGIMIGINTMAVVVSFILYMVKKPNLDRAYLLALRLGFVVFIVGNYIGGIMIQNRAHSVGVEDGGQGLPFVNWSMEGGDLRIAHFMGLHAIQAIPLFAFLLKKQTTLSLGVRSVLSILWALVYTAIFSWLYYNASRGIPLISAN